MRWICLAIIGILGGCAPRLSPQAPAHPASLAWRDAVEWSAAGDEAVEMLAEYLKVDTINAPGNEGRGARYLAALLERDGIETRLFGHAPGREGVLAFVRAKEPKEPPLCLMSHIDVVPAEDEKWPEGFGPLSGRIDEEGMLWGRGALDMKGLGILEVHAMALLQRLGVPLRRDVVLMAVADEEVSNQGTKHLIAEYWDELNCGHMINEGGFGVRDVLFDDQVVHGVSVGEKGVLWVDMVATAEPGHGSTPRGDSSVDHLRMAMRAIDERKVEPNWHPMMLEFLSRAGENGGGLVGYVLKRPALVKVLAKSDLRDNPITWASLTNTVHLTGLRGFVAPNVLPGEVRATYDVRLQPGFSADDALAMLKELTEHVPGIHFEVRHKLTSAVSEYEEDPVYDAIVAHILEGRDGHIAGPLLSVGFTDSIFARELGTRAYGYVPFVLDGDLLQGMHGHRERVPVSEVKEGTRRFFGMVVQAAADLSQAGPQVRVDRKEVPTSTSVLSAVEAPVEASPSEDEAPPTQADTEGSPDAASETGQER